MNYSTQFKTALSFYLILNLKFLKNMVWGINVLLCFPPKVLIINQDFKKLKTDKQAKRWNSKWRQRRLTL